MRVIFSRKGFDSQNGGVPSPIIDGRPVSLPIPATRNTVTTYQQLGLGELVRTATRGRLGPDSLCHADPWFAEGQCAFGQTHAAQGHLANNNVGPGDVFLFFGLFADEVSGERHHRIYGYMKIDDVIAVGSQPDREDAPVFARDHPHFLGERDRNNTVYVGPGATAKEASQKLRLTRPGGNVSAWAVPTWLQRFGLTYHGKPERWTEPGILQTVAKGQEFICDIGDDPVAGAWLDDIIAEIEGAGSEPSEDEAEMIFVMLRQPYLGDPAEQRNDPFWEFGSFGITRCHSKNLMLPRRAHELEGKRLAFAQGGPLGVRLVHVTPRIAIEHHADRCEARWEAAMPLVYAEAPIIVDNNGNSAFPAILEELAGGKRGTLVSQFSSNFRSRRRAISTTLAAQLDQGMQFARRSGAMPAKVYTDALPFPPPRVDDDRRRTYDHLKHLAGQHFVDLPSGAIAASRC